MKCPRLNWTGLQLAWVALDREEDQGVTRPSQFCTVSYVVHKGIKLLNMSSWTWKAAIRMKQECRIQGLLCVVIIQGHSATIHVYFSGSYAGRQFVDLSRLRSSEKLPSMSAVPKTSIVQPHRGWSVIPRYINIVSSESSVQRQTIF